MSHIDTFHMASRELLDVQYALFDLARAFERTGNLVVASELDSHVERIREANTRMDKAFGAELDRGFKQAQLSSNTMLEAVLAGVVVGRGE